ncbi:MAG: glycosyltransferase WbuB, partial [Tepidisphaeraceae bacterium]
LITLRPGLAGVSVPCKLYGIMAAARPALFVGPVSCETSEAIRASGCGRAIANGDVDGLLTALRELACDPSLGRAMGEAGRRAYEHTYNARRCGEMWRALLERVVSPEVPDTDPSVARTSARFGA